MDLDPREASQERAVSSEPGSSRQKPFDDSDRSARKRQRLSSGARSRSADPRSGSSVTDATTSGADSPPVDVDALSIEPQTPPPRQSPIPEPTSSRVTINLRSNKPLGPASSLPPSPRTPSRMSSPDKAVQLDISGGSSPAPERFGSSSTSSSSTVGSPKIELVMEDDEDVEYIRSPPVAIIDDDDDEEDELLLDRDPVLEFPHSSDSESLVATLRRIINFFEYDVVDNDNMFIRLRDWIERYLQSTKSERSWFDSYTKHSEFWDKLPDVVQSLSRRRNFFGTFLNRNRDGRQSLLDFFAQFAELTARFVMMDASSLTKFKEEQSDVVPPLPSRAYLSTFGYLIQKKDSNIGQNLETHYRFDWADEGSMLIRRFLDAGGSIPTLTRLVQGHLLLITKNPKTIEDLTEPSRIVDRVITDSLSYFSPLGSTYRSTMDDIPELICQGYQFFTTLAPSLDLIIEKHATCLTAEGATVHILGLARIYQAALNIDESPAEDTIRDYSQKYPTLPVKVLPRVISTEWKFTMLKKLIICAQMQLRVLGVTTICAELVDIYKKNQGNEVKDPSRQEILIHFANFIKAHKLVDYIVGTGSHPELISESGNIVGFLVVTKVYTNKETDTIWQSVTTSQDPRVVEAILRMIGTVLNLADEDLLLYMCEKAQELPLDAFTPAMREHHINLFKQLLEKATSNDKLVDATPYELCVRLIRESSVPQPDAPLGILDIQQWATTRLRELVMQGPDSEVRNRICISCIDDIASKSPSSSGSICALLGLLYGNLAMDLNILTTNHNLTRLMVEAVENTNASLQQASIPANFNSPVRQARRELLLAIILNEPKTLTPDLGKRLWDALVGNGAQSVADKETSWQILNSAAAKASSRNSFINTCFKEYLPTLEPRSYTIGALDFTREAIQAWLRDAKGDLLDEEEAARSYGLEQLWQMVLKAPPNTIEEPAINMLVEIYVDSPIVKSMPKARAHAVHLSLVNRCLKQLSYAAGNLKASADGTTNGEDVHMALSPSDDEQGINEDELIFTRSLVLLREFLRSYQTKPQFATPKLKTTLPTAPTTQIKGEQQLIKYQTFEGEKSGELTSLTVGSANTVLDLFAILKQATGFEYLKAYHWGAEVCFDEAAPSATIEELQIGKGLLLVTKQNGEEATSLMKSTSLEDEIVSHFDEFWNYLGMEEKLGREIYQFLVKFPVYHKLLNAFEDEATSWPDIFPRRQPFKCLYAVYALREYLRPRARDDKVADGRMFARSLGLIVSAIINPEVLDSCESDDLRSLLAQTLVDCFIQLLREPIPADALATFLSTDLLDRLVGLLQTARLNKQAKSPVQMVSIAFEAILEASTRHREFWQSFITAPGTPQLLRELLIEDERTSLRKSIMKQIGNRCQFSPNLSVVTCLEIAAALWPNLWDLIPSAVATPDRCEESLSLALLVFKELAEASDNSINLEHCLFRWGELLVNHSSQETMGFSDIDMVARGLSSLMFWCTSFCETAAQVIPPSRLAVQLFSKHLFPELVDDDDDDDSLIREAMPIFNITTRRYLCDIIISLTQDDLAQYKEILGLLESLPPYDHREENPYALELPFGFDRTKFIRSSTGYAGLRNQSNTCYLNSLMTQLFMNVSFRGFMMNLRIMDNSSSQKLLMETRNLFAYMQNSLRRFVEPTNFTSSIRTYDDTSIDINIQMDVDEFYNLLFDRWEGQIGSAVDKRKFRSFYGGQLVQQVKSKECHHISERLEPFSAIQCDIKGKTSLQESLQAYVDGEVMEGDNKYKCSTCDRHVNAVKRACLQDIPDNLIFHLKRFDFNLRTMQRSKINDYFSFPQRIDMRPYKVEHLMDPSADIPSDLFEVVGILVHSGTAESGHYYSYIRERPSYGKYPTWVEFNDDHVTPFDPATIESNCFGGPDYRSPGNNAYQFDKSWSAYMLFYQRSSVVQAQQQELMASKSLRSLRLPVPVGLSNFITRENELLIRRYCLFDESHAKFVLKMLENDQHPDEEEGPGDHEYESLALRAALAHLDQVVTRAKDIPDFANYMQTLNERLRACTECSKVFLAWLIQRWEAFKVMLMRNPEQVVRGEIELAVVLALGQVKQNEPVDYGLYGYSANPDDDSAVVESTPNIFPRMVETMVKLWASFHVCIRAWPEFFGLLTRMAKFGVFEVIMLLDSGFLVKALEILTADPALPPHPQYSRMLSIIQKRPATKPVPMECVIGLLEVLLRACDLTVDPVSEMDDRVNEIDDEETVPLSRVEYNLLVQHWTRGNVNILVEKLLNYNQNPRSTQAIIAMMLEGFGDNYTSIFNAIRHGIKKTATPIASSAHISAALTFCQTVESLESVEKMVLQISTVTATNKHVDGPEHLRFFKNVASSVRGNRYINQRTFLKFLLEQIPTWAPALLANYDAHVRTDTEEYLLSILFQDLPEIGDDVPADVEKGHDVMIAAIRSLGMACLKYLHEEHVRTRAAAVKAQVASILGVIESTKQFFDESSEDELDVAFREYYIIVIPKLRQLTIDEPEDEVSEEWENSDDAFSSSEVLDPIADLVGAIGGDMNDADVQL